MAKYSTYAFISYQITIYCPKLNMHCKMLFLLIAVSVLWCSISSKFTISRRGISSPPPVFVWAAVSSGYWLAGHCDTGQSGDRWVVTRRPVATIAATRASEPLEDFIS